MTTILALAGCSTTTGAKPTPHVSSEAGEQLKTRHHGPAVRPLSEVKLAPLVHEEGRPGFAFVDGRTGAAMSWTEVSTRLQSATAILVGETHDNADHHALQKRVVEAVGRERQTAVALEMVPNHLQGPLDRFNRGEIDEDGFQVAVDWPKTWGYDFELYRPIFAAGRKVGAKFFGVNAPRPLVRALAKQGVEGLSKEERAQLPKLDLADAEHRAAIKRVFTHHHPPTTGGAFDRFYSAQVLWDESMADGAARALQTFEVVVVLAGNGHVAGYRGIPNRLLRRRPEAKVLTLVPVTVTIDEESSDVIKAAIAEGEADILVVVRPREVLAI